MQKNVDKNISDPLKFLKTIYRGDRGVTGISMDSVRETVKIHIDCIFRVRGENWNYCTDWDLENVPLFVLSRGNLTELLEKV